MAKTPNYIVGSRQSSRMSYVRYKKDKKNWKFGGFFPNFSPIFTAYGTLVHEGGSPIKYAKDGTIEIPSTPRYVYRVEEEYYRKSFWHTYIWQHFSCQFEGITKMCNNLNSHNGFIRADQYTPGPHLMRIHLVRYSTSARNGKYSNIHLMRPIIPLVRIFALSE